MEYPFLKYSPCGNLTILVPDSTIPPEYRADVATEIIASGHLGAEQAGFVRTEGLRPGIAARLDMMGGELCLNATRSLAAYLYDAGLLEPESEDSQWRQGIVEVSGADEPLGVHARHTGPRTHWYEAAVDVPVPDASMIEVRKSGMYLVPLPGIAHLVLDATQYPVPAMLGPEAVGRSWQALVMALLTEQGLLDEAASGCIWLHQTSDGLAITPFVRVRATSTVYAETSCGSGTLAAALVTQLITASATHPLQIRQPSGASLLVTPAVKQRRMRISGEVRLLARGSVFVDCL